MTMDERTRAAVIQEQAIAIERIRDACETYQRGGVTYRHVVELIEDVIEGQARIVRVGHKVHTPEVQG
jgi:hypothetical protein